MLSYHSATYHSNTYHHVVSMYSCWIMCTTTGLDYLSHSSIRVRPTSILIMIVSLVLSTETDTEQVFSFLKNNNWMNGEEDITFVFKEIKSDWRGGQASNCCVTNARTGVFTKCFGNWRSRSIHLSLWESREVFWRNLGVRICKMSVSR